MSVTGDGGDPAQAVAVSPTDQSSDRKQSDANQAVNEARNDADRAALVAVQAANVARSDEDRASRETNQLITEGRLDSLIAVSSALSASATDVAENTRRELAAATKQRKRFMYVMFSMAAIVVVLLSMLVIVGFELRSYSLDRDAQHRQILDCVTPTGSCLKARDSATAKAVDTVDQVSVVAVACALDYGSLPIAERIAATEKCVKTRLPK